MFFIYLLALARKSLYAFTSSCLEMFFIYLLALARKSLYAFTRSCLEIFFIYLPALAWFTVARMSNFGNSILSAKSTTVHTSTTLVEINPRLVFLGFSYDCKFRAIYFHEAICAIFAFQRLNYGSSHFFPPYH